jgi:hypothetical protein
MQIMQYNNLFKILLLAFAALTLTVNTGCDSSDDDDIAISNDFRLLQLKAGDDPIMSGITDVSVLTSLTWVFSHGVDQTAFEGALSMSPEVPFTLDYDETNSIITMTFDEPLAFETSYAFNLPQGKYGQGGEASTADINFEFTTAAFNAPPVTLSTETTSFFEGETIQLVLSIDGPILEDVEATLVASGTAEAGVDYTLSSMQFQIPSGETADTIELEGIPDAQTEGEETILLTLMDLNNAVEMMPQALNLTLGDTPPEIELQGILSLKIGGTSTNGRAIHMRILEDIPDLSVFGIGIANNGGGSDGREIDFPSESVSAGDHILLVRDIDEMGIMNYFEECFNDFALVIPSGGVNFNGDDPVELFKNTTVIESYGDVEVDGTGEEWEFTGTWAYKLKGVWEYGALDCTANSTTTSSSDCVYPFCQAVQLQGALALLWDGSGTNGGKAVHIRANRDISDLSIYGLGVANNGGGTDGIEVNFSAQSLQAGDHVLVAREPGTIAEYLGSCFNDFDVVVQDDGMNQNGDDAIELFEDGLVIETYGDVDVDGTGQFWEYAGSWGYKVGGAWVYGGVDCAAGSTSTQTSACPYAFCQ